LSGSQTKAPGFAGGYLLAEGRSITEAVEIAQGLTRKIVESCLEHGDPLPLAFNKLCKSPLDLLIPVGVR